MSENPEERFGRQGLFRSAAVTAAAGSDLGEPLQSYWLGVRLFSLVALTLVTGLVAFAAHVEYAKVHRVRAYVDSREGLVRLSAPASGSIAQLLVKEGDQVEAGAPLAVISSDKLGGDGSGYRAALTLQLEGEKQAIGREIVAAEAEAQAQQTLLARRQEGLRQERVQAQVDIGSATQLLKSLQEQSDRLNAVAAAGFATRSQIDQKRDEVASQESRLAIARATLARIDRDIATAQAERAVVDARLRAVIESRNRAAQEVDRRLVEGTAEAQQTVRAAQAGTVSSSQISVGQSVVAGQALFTLTPLNDTLVVRLLVPARTVAAARPGTAIRLAFQSYPQERFGSFAATVESVSGSPLLPADASGPYGLAAEPMFVAVAAIDRTLRAPGGEPLALRPGMLADALVALEQRSVLAWLLDPLLRGFNQSAGRLPSAPATGTP